MDAWENKLIDTIRNYYPTICGKSKTLEDKEKRERCWQEVAQVTKLSVGDCKSKWRIIRDNYKKFRNKKLNGVPYNHSKYDDEKLQFLDGDDDVVIIGSDVESVIDNNVHPDNSQEDNGYFVEIAPMITPEISSLDDPLSKKRKLDNVKNTQIHTFFSSMADVVCQLPPDVIAKVRLEVCKIVTNAELMTLYNKNIE